MSDGHRICCRHKCVCQNAHPMCIASAVSQDGNFSAELWWKDLSRQAPQTDPSYSKLATYMKFPLRFRYHISSADYCLPDCNALDSNILCNKQFEFKIPNTVSIEF